MNSSMLQRLFPAWVQGKRCDRRSEKSRRQRGLHLEGLEKRELFVVGAFAVPATVTTGTGFDGVVQILAPASGRCSGSLLATGQHILTAAHCVDQDVDTDGDGTTDIGNGTVDAGTYSVTFNLPGRDVTIPATDISIPGAWNGNWSSNDIAIITLPELAPIDAERYGVYRNTDEVGKTVTMVGYGITGTGAPLPGNPAGSRPGTGGVKRSGTNVLDAAITNNSVLRLDLDGVAGTEAITANGDSGGPGFLRGQIATVTSYGNLQSQFTTAGVANYGLGNAFGVTAGHTRVSRYAAWIDSVLAQRRNVIIDLQDQPAGNDAVDDTVQIKYNSSNSRIEVALNGQLIFSELWERVGKLDIQGSNDREVFTMDSDTLMATKLSIDGNGGINSFKAFSSSYAKQWTILGSNQGELLQDSTTTIAFTEIQNLVGSSGVDHFKFRAGGAITGRLDGGLGKDLLDYSLLTTSVSVDLLTGRASHVGLGSSAHMTGIEDVSGGSGGDFLKGSNVTNVLRGNGGVDEIIGRGGDDWLYGGAQNDFLYGDHGFDHLYGDGEDDYLDGGRDGVRDELFGGLGRDTYVDYWVWVTGGSKSSSGFWISEDKFVDANWLIDTRKKS